LPTGWATRLTRLPAPCLGSDGNVGVLCGSLQDIWQQGVAAQLGRALLDAGLNALIVDATNDP